MTTTEHQQEAGLLRAAISTALAEMPTPKPDAPAALIYARMSMDTAGKELGLTRQVAGEDGAIKLCAARGWTVTEDHIFTDNDLSASTGVYRPGYAELIAAVERGEAAIIVTYQLSRLWRNRRERASTLEDRLRYTPSSVFETFTWPDPLTDKQRERITEASRNVIARRRQICAANSFGLTTLYNLVDEGAYSDLKALHCELDEAVAAAYGWPKAVAQDGDETVQRLLILNREIAAGTRKYDPFDEELVFIPPPRAEVSRLTPERQPRRSGTGRAAGSEAGGKRSTGSPAGA